MEGEELACSRLDQVLHQLVGLSAGDEVQDGGGLQEIFGEPSMIALGDLLPKR